MGKSKKKEAKKQSTAQPALADLEAELDRLRKENEVLRSRLAEIRDLSSDAPHDDNDLIDGFNEDEEEDEEVDDRSTDEREPDATPV
jgi:hypothetical protein